MNKKEYDLLINTDNKDSITPVENSIFTAESIIAHFPYGGSSGNWGNCGKGFIENLEK